MSDWLETRLRELTNERAEYAMTHTNTERELIRFRGQLAHSQRSRRIRIAVAFTATAAVAAGVVALVLALTGNTAHKALPPAKRPAPQATTAPADFPVGDYVQPGAAPPTEMRLSASRATVDRGGNVLTGLLSFPAPGQVQFDCFLDEVTPCLSRCLYDYHSTGRTLEFVLVRQNAMCRSNDLVSSATWQRRR